MKCRDVDGRAESSAEVFRDNTTTLAEYLVSNAFTIPRPSYWLVDREVMKVPLLKHQLRERQDSLPSLQSPKSTILRNHFRKGAHQPPPIPLSYISFNTNPNHNTQSRPLLPFVLL